MLLSLVTGTFNRRQYLAQFVSSARQCIPRAMDYEFVVVDGGSNDGTIQWCEQQPDIVLIQHGELRGAIRAFTDGGNASHGEYVLICNDDIKFLPNSIVPGIVYLETHPTCGGIAFADDRPAPGYGEGFKVQTFTVRDTNGQDISVPYAQVGLFRNWLARKAGYWGADDPVMGTGRTYGGDNFLSAKCYALGYTIDAVPECRVNDLVPRDNLREINQQYEQQNPAVYYKAFPTPPQFVTPPTLPNPQTERLRVLYMPIYERDSQPQQEHKRGLREALQRQGLVYEIDYVNARYDLTAAVDSFQPHLLLTQMHAPSIPVDELAAMRAKHPGMLVVNWNGDVHEAHLTTPEMLAFLRHFDLQLTVNASVLPVYAENNIPAAYWQVSFEPVDYDNLPDVPAHDVVFLANGYSEDRRALGHILQSLPGINVGLYGRGWTYGNGDTTYNFPAGAALYGHARIAIGDNAYANRHGFVSNRIFEVLASGAFLLHQTVPGLQELTGLVDGEHYVSWQDVDDLQTKIRYWLAARRDAKRQQIAAAGREYVREHHSFDRRVEELFTLIQEKVGQGRQVA